MNLRNVERGSDSPFEVVLQSFEELAFVLRDYKLFETWLAKQQVNNDQGRSSQMKEFIDRLEESLELLVPNIIKGEIGASDTQKIIMHLKPIGQFSNDLISHYNGLQNNYVIEDFEVTGIIKVNKDEFFLSPLSVVHEINQLINSFGDLIFHYQSKQAIEKKVPKKREKAVSFGYNLNDGGVFLQKVYEKFTGLHGVPIVDSRTNAETFKKIFMAEDLNKIDLENNIVLLSRKGRSFAFLFKKLEDHCFSKGVSSLFDDYKIVCTSDDKHFTQHDYRSALSGDGNLPYDHKKIDKALRSIIEN